MIKKLWKAPSVNRTT